MKKIISILLVLSLSCSLCIHAFAAEGAVHLAVDSTVVSAGDTVQVTVSLENTAKIKALSFQLSYDSAAISIGTGTWLPTNAALKSFGKMRNIDVAVINFEAEEDLNKEILVFSITIQDNFSGETTLTLTPTAKDAGGKVLSCTAGSITFSTGCKHDTELRNASPASCTESGYSGDLVCKLCEETIETGHEIAALGHDWIADDETHFHCSRCTATKSVVDLSGGSNAVQAEVIGDTASIVTDTAAGVGSTISLEALQTAVKDNGLRSVEISTGMGASTVVGGGKSGSAAITDADGKVFFKAEAMGGQFRYDKKIKNGGIVGTYAQTGSKASAIDYVDIRLQYKMTLPEGVKLKDCTWSWELIYLEKSHPVTGSNFQSVGDGTNSYLSNVVLTNIPAASYADMEIRAFLSVSFTLDGVSYTMSQSVSSPLTRSIGSMNEYYKNTMYSSLSDEAKVYVNELSKYTEKVTPVV